MSKKDTRSASNHVRPIILCGGSGSRLWPVSRKSYPKQFLEFVTHNTMFQETLNMVRNDKLFFNPTIVSSDGFCHLIQRQAREIDAELGTIMLEPIARNTAAAITAAAILEMTSGNPDTLLLVMPSDHHVEHPEKLHQTVMRALPAAEQGALVVFGIKPSAPETGYGYIQCGEELTGCQTGYKVDQFCEKPDRETAQQFVADERYYWNSGMFLFRADRILREVEKFHPEIVSHCQRAVAEASDSEGTGGLVLDKACFAEAPSISIDYAVMERTSDAVMLPATFQWSDVGSWTAVADLGVKDGDGNVVPDNTLLQDCANTYVRSDRRLIAGLGLTDQIIIDTGDVVLVADKSRVQEIKGVVEALTSMDHPSVETHRKVSRPWGSYESVHHGKHHQVKHIVVAPGETLSLQYHHHRSEHWVVVAGVAEVTIGSRTRFLETNQSTYIPLKEVHRLHNPGAVPMHLIEVQFGDYLGEDDIVRLDDVYGRAPVQAEVTAS